MSSQLITANVVVQFGEDVAAFAEVDDRVDGFNNGKTSFAPGDDVYLLLFKPVGFEVKFSTSTSGILTRTGTAKKQVEEILQFPNSDSISPQYPVSNIAANGNVPVTWYGNNLGNVTKKGDNLLVLPPRSRNPATGIPTPQYRIGIAVASWEADCEVWRLRGAALSALQVMCFWVVGRAT